jgi:hypothetical protein
MHFKYLIVFTLLLIAHNGVCQSNAGQSFAISDSVFNGSGGNSLRVIYELQKIKPEEDDEMGQGIWPQALMSYQSFAGQYDSALYFQAYNLRKYRTANWKAPKQDDDFLQNKKVVTLREALPAILANQQIVMMNEAHYNPANRATLISLLPIFMEYGFGNLAIEGLYNYQDIEAIHQRGYPVDSSGFYIREPLFAEMIRQAVKRGFNLVAYESEISCDDWENEDGNYCNRFRDSIQAVNISRWVKQHPNEKLLVYAGHDHILEKSKGTWKHMAQFVQEMTSIDPLTLEQTKMLEQYYPEFESSQYVTVASKISEPSVIKDSEKGYLGNIDGADVQVFYPRYLSPESRPGFYSLNGERKEYTINNKLDTAKWVAAYYANEEGNRLPADIINLNRHQTLYLYPGSYQLVYSNLKGEELYNEIIDVR